MPKAGLWAEERFDYEDGSFVEMVVWIVPEPVEPSRHAYKYRLVYIIDGNRVIGYDNERGKGDHRHWMGTERPYTFVSIPRVLADFLADVEKMRSDNEGSS